MFTACQSEEEDLFDSSAAQRLEASKVTYTQRLPQATAGWVMEFYPTNGGSWPRGNGYLILAQFNKDLSVRMAMMNEEMSDGLYLEDTSLWEVIADQGPVLSFNSYNKCLHSFADPAIYETGLGLEGDYEFEIINLEDDAEFAMLKGKKRGTYVRLSRLDEGTDFEEYLNDVNDFASTMFNPAAPNKLLINFNGSRFEVNSAEDGFLDFFPDGGDAISQSTAYPFLITKRSGNYYLRFRDDVLPDSVEEGNSIQEMIYDANADRFVSLDNPNKYLSSYFTTQEFFNTEFDKGHVFKVNRTAAENELSEKMRQALEDAHNGIKGINKNYFINELTLKVDTINGARWAYKYQSGKSARDIEYLYSCSVEGDKISFTYQKADQTNGENIKSRVDAISTLLEQVLSQQFIVTKFTTEFNLSKIKFTAASDPELWFVINY